jgi:hypothetical protein
LDTVIIALTIAALVIIVAIIVLTARAASTEV